MSINLERTVEVAPMERLRRGAGVRCDQCKHWMDLNRPHEELKEAGLKYCDAMNFGWAISRQELAGEKAVVIDEEQYSASFYTGADFFCAKFEQKTEETTP